MEGEEGEEELEEGEAQEEERQAGRQCLSRRGWWRQGLMASPPILAMPDSETRGIPTPGTGGPEDQMEWSMCEVDPGGHKKGPML